MPFLLLLLLVAPPQPSPDSPWQSTPKPPGAKPFAPGVRIDWGKRRVEVDAKVVLRKGPLELVACTQGTKEHESILLVNATATHMYQAMGLAGLEPGRPAHFDESTNKMIAPKGQRLKVHARFRINDETITVPVDRWLLHSSSGLPVEHVPWVFAGSRLLPDGRLGADADGTILCVVDFDTALMAVGSLHTADNSGLWVVANPHTIPPLSTPCVLLLSAAAPPPLVLSVDSLGRFFQNDSEMSPEQVVAIIAGSKNSTCVLIPATSQLAMAVIEKAARKLARRDSQTPNRGENAFGPPNRQVTLRL